MRTHRSLTLSLVFAFVAPVLVPGCGDGPASMPDPMPPAASFLVQSSVEQLMVTHAKPGAALTLLDTAGQTVQSGTADELGSWVFRKVAPGSGYVVRAVSPASPGGALTEESLPLTVMSIAGSKPAPSFYSSQRLAAGSGYITTRDGTKLSVYVTLPGPIEDGPYPTVVNYSGYDPARPGEPVPGFEGLCGTFPALCDRASDPSAFIASLMGYATVSVNLRGTGCSGGAFDFFDDLALLDAYDVIETAAAQPFVLHNKVGMTGLSYPGYSQLFVAAQQPPGLAAITPLSVFGDTFQVLMPGGLLNTGFAVEWAKGVWDKAGPYKQGWEQARVDAGDTICKENQLLHGQKYDIIKQIKENPYYRADLGDRLTPTKFADKIGVPVFMACAWQDEQTGPYFTSLMSKLTAAPVRRFTVYNGVHVDGFAPQNLVEWKTFLDLYVARKIPSVDSRLRSVAPLLLKEVFGVQMDLPPDRFADAPSYEAARMAYEAEADVRVLFESGGSKTPGTPESTAMQRFAAWPPKETQPLRLYLQADGTLRETAPTAAASASSFQPDLAAGMRGVLAPGGNVWDLLPKYDYRPLDAGHALAFVSEPLTSDQVMVGTGSADLWLQSTASDADLQVSVTEVRPDGQEMYVQSGWLRASQRALATSATAMWPEHTHLKEDAAPLQAGTYVPMRVGIPGFAHVFRTGSRVRVSIETPGDVRAAWKFQLEQVPAGTVHRIAHASGQPSSVLLPVLGGVKVATPLPACPSLRGQPCRAYKPLTNTPVM